MLLSNVTDPPDGMALIGWSINAEAADVTYKPGASAEGLVGTGETITLYAVWVSATEMPKTGGMGTDVFVMTGLALVLGAGLVLAVRRRKQR